MVDVKVNSTQPGTTGDLKCYHEPRHRSPMPSPKQSGGEMGTSQCCQPEELVRNSAQGCQELWFRPQGAKRTSENETWHLVHSRSPVVPVGVGVGLRAGDARVLKAVQQTLQAKQTSGSWSLGLRSNRRLTNNLDNKLHEDHDPQVSTLAEAEPKPPSATRPRTATTRTTMETPATWLTIPVPGSFQ